MLFDDPLEQGVLGGQGVDARHSIIVKATQDRAARLRAETEAKLEQMSSAPAHPSAKL